MLETTYSTMAIPNTSSKALLAVLHDFCLQQGFEKNYWIAYSGGLDSHVLLSLCHQLRSFLPVKLHAIHINHGISQYADDWAKHCADVCKEYEIDYVERAIQIDLNTGDSFEEVAREKRYAIFSDCLHEGDVLLTAHHQDDQAETLLLQLFRGAGLKGLAAMPSFKPFGCGFHGRPLLSFPRSLLETYAAEYHLVWMNDESNLNVKLTRNFIRHDILPLLKTRWPTVTNAISRSAAHCAESQRLLEEFALEEYEIVKGSTENSISVEKLLRLDSAKQKWMLRTWIGRLGYPMPDAKKIETIRRDVLMANWDRSPCISWETMELRRHRDHLYLMKPLQEHDPERVFIWDLTMPLFLPPIGVLRAEPVMGRGLRADIKEVSIKFRQGGEKISIAGRGKLTLKNLFQEWGVLPWERDRIPLIFVGQTLAGVAGYHLAANYTAENNVKGYELVFEPSHKL